MSLLGKGGEGPADDLAQLPKHHKATKNEKLVIVASSLGTMFEWYDFYLYGLLATYISGQFFSGVNDTTASFWRLQLSRPALPCARLARWCLVALVTWWGVNIHS
nr:hypothetical protein [Kordiimonas gwangyangensis]